MQLRIPTDIRQQADDRRRAIEPESLGDVTRILPARPVKHDPVEQPFTTTGQVLRQFAVL